MNPPSQITAPTPRERANGDLDPAEQERKIPQAVLFGAMRQTAGVNRGQTPRQNRKGLTHIERKMPRQSRNVRRTPSANRRNRTPHGRAPSATAPNKTAMSGADQAQPPRQNRRHGRAPSATTPAESQIRTRAKRNRPARATGTDTRQAQPPRQSRNVRRAPSAEHPDSPNQPAAACPHSEFRIPPAVPPRAQSPVPALKPAGRSIAPAHNPLSHRAEYRFFASARSGVCGRKARRSYSYAEQETP